MVIKPTFKQSDVRAYLQKKALEIHNQVVQRFLYLGEQCLIEARTNKTYMDQTGNLTASMGYVVTYNGEIIRTAGFEKGGGRTSGATGKLQGRELATSLVSRFKKGYSLIVVAGMNYAYAVESRGKNVLSSAELLAEREFPNMLKRLKLR